jgi:hypothetical protein
MNIRGLTATAVALALTLAACGPPIENENPAEDPFGGGGGKKRLPESQGKIFGGLDSLLKGEEKAAPGSGGAGGGTGIGVNAYLWRASLDTISFMPVASADPFGGVIITDWYSPPDSPEERFKINLYILGTELRADGLRASVFRQVKRNGEWIDADVDSKTATELENAVLTRARELRVAGR